MNLDLSVYYSKKEVIAKVKKRFEHRKKVVKKPEFTGVFDKNLVPIYSCDMVKDNQMGITYEVKKTDRGWRAVSARDGRDYDLFKLVHSYAVDNHLYKDDDVTVLARKWRGEDIAALLGEEPV